jgi:hypothetical protein
VTDPAIRQLEVAPERLERWLAGFAARHGATSFAAEPDTVTVTAADGAVARCTVPFPPLPIDPDQPFGGLVDHAAVGRRVGVVLVRRGGYAAGVFDRDRLVTSKVGTRLVQGRTAAGGQSQRRFARRRQKQAREAFEEAADVVARVVVPLQESLEAVVVGGDRAAVAEVMRDHRLATLARLVVPPHLAVPDPRLAVLKSTPASFRSVRITLTAPTEAASSQ